MTGRLPQLVNLDTGETYTLDGPALSLGRAPDNNIVLPDDGYASGEHAKIYWNEGTWWLEDLMSSNGTHVNDQLINGPYRLNPNDVIRLGRTSFRIE